MTELQRGIACLINSAITEKPAVLPPDFSMEEAMPIIRKHQIVALAYEGAVRCGISQALPCMGQLFQMCCQSMLISVRQTECFGAIAAAFDAAGIDYMPLKGSVLKSLYPKPELRSMGDIDILIHPDQQPLIREQMIALGFTEGIESDHELHWAKDSVHVELHKRLIPSYNKDYYAYYGDGWRFAVPTDRPHRFCLSDEDEFVYMLTHFAKHYRDSGIGCRHITDLWVYRRAHPDLDEAVITAELEKLKLDVFYRNVLQTIDHWFADGAENEITALITDTVFNSGAYGTKETSRLSSGLKSAKVTGNSRDAGWVTFLKAVFLPLVAMQQKFPVLKKAPVLLPVFWIVRVFQTLFFRTDKLQKAYRKAKEIDPQAVDAYQVSLNKVGLDYHFR